MPTEIRVDNAEAEEEVVVATPLPDDDEDDDDAMEVVASDGGGDDEVVAAVVVGDDEDDDGADDEDESTVATVEPVVKPKKKPGRKKGAKKRPPAEALSPADELFQALPPQSVDAAQDARAMLKETVPTLPYPLTESQVLSFGKLKIQNLPNRVDQENFNTTSALYPVGFTCDRYEFSPVHGRVLKMRCSILDGKELKLKVSDPGKYKDLSNGPVFRIMWGRGIDDDDIDKVDYPYDPYTHSLPIVQTGNAEYDKLIEEAVFEKPKQVYPEPGMRVKVRLEENKYSYGTVTDVGAPRIVTVKRKRKKTVELSVQYDEGAIETFNFPDPDLSLVMPGVVPDVENGEVELTKVNGQPVTTVVGNSPLHAWGKALVRLGLIDEIMLKEALEAVEVSRKEGLKEAKEKLDNKGSSPKKEPESQASEEAKDDKADAAMEEDREPPTEEELALLKELKQAEAEYEAAKEEDRKATLELANARIRDLGPFLCNPFADDEKSQLSSWLATAVRREKTRMGSTGNKRKIVTAIDLLERNDAFYNSDIEALIEGLPGAEFCDSYVFQAFRNGGGLSRSWVHEAQLRNEREAKSRLKRYQEQEYEPPEQRPSKRRVQDPSQNSRKKQKLDEVSEKRQVRVNERLARLDLQVNDRLFREAAFQRERVVINLAKGLTKEYQRRRKFCEIITAQKLKNEEYEAESKSVPAALPSSAIPEAGNAAEVRVLDLPPTSTIYDEECVKIWNYMSTFKDFFLEKGWAAEVPTLKHLQASIDVVKGSESASMSRDDAVASLTQIAVALCQPLAASLTRSLFASLIALNPSLQKDFGAAFFNEVNAAAPKVGKDGKIEEAKADDNLLLPVNSMTWQEIARLTFLADAFGELGLSKHETAHLLRGYRSAGHPNSKEARRLRKVEDCPIAIMRQKIAELGMEDKPDLLSKHHYRVSVPCDPSELPAGKNKDGTWLWKAKTPPLSNRHYVGLLESLWIDNSERKRLVHAREKYMEEALRLKEEMELQRRKEQGEDVDDDDDDDDDDDESKAGDMKKPAEDSKPEAMQVDEGEKSAKPESSGKIGKPTPYDDFCEDIPTAPEVIRRCLAVLRAVSNSNPAEPFLYPVDPQTNPGYYDMVLSPMCLRECGRQLMEAAAAAAKVETNLESFLEEVVLRFGRNMRLIEHNSLTYGNAGPTVIAAGTELLRLFERLFFDWVLVPEHLLPPLEELDDDRCVEQHQPGETKTVVFCDACEGKYSILRLDPPLAEIPKGDWYCPRCISGRWYGAVDPRIGKSVAKVEGPTPKSGVIQKSFYAYPAGGIIDPSFVYLVKYGDGIEETWSLSDVDKALAAAGQAVPPIRCLQAVMESVGYGSGIDNGFRRDIIPSSLRPHVSDSSAQVAVTSSVFRDTIAASGALLVVQPNEMNAEEWLRLLVLLVMKGSSSDVIQNITSNMENTAASKMQSVLDKVKKLQCSNVMELIPEGDCSLDNVHFEGERLQSQPAPAAAKPPPGAAPSLPESPQQKKAEPVVMNAVAVEVVDNPKVPSSPGSTAATTKSAATVPAKPAAKPAPKIALKFAGAFSQKNKRLRATDESFSAMVIKSQLQPTVASFSEDTFSPVVDGHLAPKDPGLSFFNKRCRDMVCAYCGLNDKALGTPLVRAPNDAEWDELMPLVGRSRRTHVVAETADNKLVAVKIRVGGNLMSVEEATAGPKRDGYMLEFAPVSPRGFQHELAFRYESDLPFITGSLTAHECCASSAHSARKEVRLQKYKVKKMDLIERDAGMTCGRTLELGRDSQGRSFWKFDESDTNSLFVSTKTSSWCHYGTPETIASVIVTLGDEKVVKDLKRAYPEASAMIEDKSWRNALLKRHYLQDQNKRRQSPRRRDSLLSYSSESFEFGQEVLVESKSGNALWDATIAEVSKKGVDKPEIDAYLVAYKGFSSSFQEWVQPDRVVGLSEHNRKLQTQLFEERSIVPKELHFLNALTYLHAVDRARPIDAALPDFWAVAKTHETMDLLKTALLVMEAALPMGSIDTRENGSWRPEFSNQWRLNVLAAHGPATLMQCVIVFEDAIADDHCMKENYGHVRSCLPARWKAVLESSVSSLAVRIIMLDRSLAYGNVDKKRYAKRKKKKPKR